MNLLDNEPDSAAPAASGLSRRGLIGVAGAVGITAALRALPAAAATGLASAPAGHRSFLGSDHDVFKEIKYGQTINGVKYPGVPGLSGVRVYAAKPTGPHMMVDHIAKKWPEPPVPGAGPIVYSIYPVPQHVLDGSLDHALKQLIDTAPPGSYLTTWHEALSLKFPRYITSEHMYQLHARMNTLARGTHVTYGSIFGGGDLAHLFRSVPPDLGFYGLDLYLDAKERIGQAMDRLEQFIAMAKKKDTRHHYPKLMIPECNTHVEARRPEWFTTVCQRMHGYGSHSVGVLTFWHKHGPLSGPWLPKDRKTIDAMAAITDHIF